MCSGCEQYSDTDALHIIEVTTAEETARQKYLSEHQDLDQILSENDTNGATDEPYTLTTVRNFEMSSFEHLLVMISC